MLLEGVTELTAAPGCHEARLYRFKKSLLRK